jgi:hypothetical protein
MATYFSPLNDIALEIPLKTVDPVTGVVSTLTTGTVTGFLATTNTSSATAADPTLVVTCNYSSTKRKWIVTMDAALLTTSLCTTHFATPGLGYLILQSSGNFRGYMTLTYRDARPITVT